MKLIFDVDGVLADFTSGFRRLAHEMFGTPKEIDYENYTWDNVGGGLTKEQISRVWDSIKKSTSFWLRLSPLITDDEAERLLRLDKSNHELYFVTSRVGPNPKRQTEYWLIMNLGLFAPTVIVSNRKGEIAAGIKADYCIDDKAGNAVYVAYHSPRTKSYILDQPYNRFPHDVLGSRVRRVGTLKELLDDVEARR